jgi:hypothetical protein
VAFARLLFPVQEAAYRLQQELWSAWAQRRYRDAFEDVRAFCLFVGYPRSGHSLVGALLNAHRNAVISHELNAPQLILSGCTRNALYSRILARASWFNLRGNTSTYPYQVPNQWQGRFEALRVIGDKRGGAVTRCVAANPDFLPRLRSLVGVPLRLLHVVRNPFDNISAISIRHQLSLAESIDYYFLHCRTTAMLGTLCPPGEVLTVRHEEMVRDPRTVLSSLCAFLALEPEPEYLEACCGVVFHRPSYTRRKVTWPRPLVQDVDRRARTYPFLDGYEFEIRDDAPARDRPGP